MATKSIVAQVHSTQSNCLQDCNISKHELRPVRGRDRKRAVILAAEPSQATLRFARSPNNASLNPAKIVSAQTPGQASINSFIGCVPPEFISDRISSTLTQRLCQLPGVEHFSARISSAGVRRTSSVRASVKCIRASGFNATSSPALHKIRQSFLGSLVVCSRIQPHQVRLLISTLLPSHRPSCPLLCFSLSNRRQIAR
jgi:hypothetical protein